MGDALISNTIDLHFTPTKVCILFAPMAAVTSCLPLSATILLLLLFLSSTSIAVPISRTRNLMDERSLGHDKVSGYIPSVKESWEISESNIDITERMNLEVNDYPGSGANNRHTPRP
ncbi:unnamed protein product [Lactuca saligna]|uniref:Uncharacterized protein n=1 Tax=Lactuca saligna TaxID=75948 RepID=A0AA35Z1R4_LACSI|nr:unnamed protein product [Lactuca saligna]